MILRAAHAAGLMCGRLKDRQAHFQTDRVVAPHQLLQLFLRHVQLFASFEVNGVDDAVGVNVLAVNMGADQHLAALEVFCQPPRGFVGLSGIDRRALRKALHHVVEHHAAVRADDESLVPPQAAGLTLSAAPPGARPVWAEYPLGGYTRRLIPEPRTQRLTGRNTGRSHRLRHRQGR